MNSKYALFGALLPLVVFWIAEEFWGLKAALILGCIFAVGEIAWEKKTRGKVSTLTLASNFLVIGLGAVSFVMHSGLAFKLQPMIMEISMAGFLCVMRMKGEGFFINSLKDFRGIDENKRNLMLSQPWILEKFKQMEIRLIIFLCLHGLAVGWAAVWGSTRMWILLKGILFYVLLVLIAIPMYKKPNAN